MRYSWPYNFVLYVLCDVEPVKGFEIRDIDLLFRKYMKLDVRGAL